MRLQAAVERFRVPAALTFLVVLFAFIIAHAFERYREGRCGPSDTVASYSYHSARVDCTHPPAAAADAPD